MILLLFTENKEWIQYTQYSKSAIETLEKSVKYAER